MAATNSDRFQFRSWFLIAWDRFENSSKPSLTHFRSLTDTNESNQYGAGGGSTGEGLFFRNQWPNHAGLNEILPYEMNFSNRSLVIRNRDLFGKTELHLYQFEVDRTGLVQSLLDQGHFSSCRPISFENRSLILCFHVKFQCIQKSQPPIPPPHHRQIPHQAGLLFHGSWLSLSCFHASRTYFCSDHASRITPIPPCKNKTRPVRPLSASLLLLSLHRIKFPFSGISTI